MLLQSRGTPSPAANAVDAVARRIEAEIGAAPAGTVLGSEASLRARLNVGRTTFRQAIRRLERGGVVEARRGGGGGLIVSRSARERAVRDASTAFTMLGASLEDLATVSVLVNGGLAAAAAQRATEAQARGLRIIAARAETAETLTDYARYRREFYTALVSASGDMLAGILHEAAIDGTTRAMPIEALSSEPFKRNVARLKIADLRLADAIAAGDPRRAENAGELAADHLRDAILESIARGYLSDAAQTAWSRCAIDSKKAGERIAWLLRADIARLPTGAPLGSEAALAQRFDVGAGTVRESLGILEEFGLVEVRRGMGGGAFSAAFDMDAASTALARRLTYAGLRDDEIWRAETVLEREAAQMAALRKARLRPDHPLTAQIAAACGNTVLAFLILTLSHMTGINHASTGLEAKLARAIRSGDRDLARRFSTERAILAQTHAETIV